MKGLEELKSKLIEQSLFDRKLYLTLYEDVRSSDIDPLEHFIKYGISENRYPSVNFSPEFYRNQFTGIKDSELLFHLVKNAGNEKVKLISSEERRRLTELKLIIDSDYWDADYYLNTYKDIKESGANPLLHFYNIGSYEGRNPSGKFNTKFYAKSYANELITGQIPLIHYLKVGKRSGIITMPPALPGKAIDKNLQLDHSFLYFFDSVKRRYSINGDNVFLYISGWVVSRVKHFKPALVLEICDGKKIDISISQFRHDVEDKFGISGIPTGFLKPISISKEIKELKIYEKQSKYILFQGSDREFKIIEPGIRRVC